MIPEEDMPVEETSERGNKPIVVASVEGAKEDVIQPAVKEHIPSEENKDVDCVESSDFPVRGMKWFKFVVKVQLWFSFALTISNGLQYATGDVYGDYKDGLYCAVPKVQAISIGYSLFLFIFSAYIFMTRKKLANFEVDAPKNLFVIYVINIIHPFIYSLLMCATTGLAVGDWITNSQIISASVGVVLLITNIIYFSNRKNMFVNLPYFAAVKKQKF